MYVANARYLRYNIVMGKIEQIKLARKMLKEEYKQQEGLKQYRNKMFVYGFVTGFVVSLLVSAAFFTSRSSKEAATNNLTIPNISTNSATIAPDLNLPSDIQLPQASATPIL